MSSPSTPSSFRNLLMIGALTGIDFFETGLVMFSASQIMAGLNLSPEAFAFAYTLYGMAAIFMLYKHQWMVERFGYRDFVLLSLVVFALGAILCATASDLAQFAIGRALQGLGGATFFTAGRMQVNRELAATRFHRLLIFIVSLIGASAIAPVGAAVLIGIGGWRALFWIVLPLTFAIAWIAAPCLSREVVLPDERSQEHWGWLLWMALGVFGLQYAIQELPLRLSENVLQIVGIGLLSALMLSIFAWRQWRRERPLIDYRGLFQWRYLLGLVLYFSGFFMAGTSSFVLPIFFKRALGWSLASTAGIVSFGMCGSILSAMVHATLSRRWPRPLPYMFCALAFYATGSFMLSRVGGSAGCSDVMLPVFLCGAAIPFFLGPVAFGTFSELAPQLFSHGYQVMSIVRQLGMSSSIALATVALQVFYGNQVVAEPESGHPIWELALHVSQSDTTANDVSGLLVVASGNLFLAMALLVIPLAILLRLQRIFR